MQQGGGGRGGRGGGGRGAAAQAAPEPAQDAGGRGGRGGGGRGGRGGGGGGGIGENRVVFSYTQQPADLLISGGMNYAYQMTGTPALVHSRIGNGNVVMFSFNPFWRGETLGAYALVFNTFLHHANLNAGSATQ
jgi:hypothetical protein